MLYPAKATGSKKSTRISKKNKKSYKRVERTTFCLGEHKKGEYLERFLCVFIKRFDKMQFCQILTSKPMLYLAKATGSKSSFSI